jgi:hypothetical protein
MGLLKRFKEMIVSKPTLGLRNIWSGLRGTFWATPVQPQIRYTAIDTDLARSLYYNTDPSINMGAGFTRPIIDSCADYVGVPHLLTTMPDLDDILRTCVEKYWKKSLWEIYRNAMRDSMTWVRVRRPFPHPLVTSEEEDTIYLEIVDKDRVVPYYNPQTGYLDRIEIATMVFIEDTAFDPTTVIQTGIQPTGREHEIIEIITNDTYTYYDRTAQVYLDNLTTANTWGFIGFVPFYNDFDSALNGGACEVETVYPLLQAFHNLFAQLARSSSYQSAPKVKFKLNDVQTFIKNNFPGAFTATGEFTGNINWRGNEIFFMESDEDVGFIETAATSETQFVTLMSFVLDCICIVSETPEWALFRPLTETQSDNAQTLRFEQRVTRKRFGWTASFQELAKMALVIYGSPPVSASVEWDELSTATLAAKAQAMNQTIAAAEVANRAGAISMDTYMNKIRGFFGGMKDNQAEQTKVVQDMRAQAALQAEINPPIPQQTNGNNPNAPNAVRSRLPMTVIPPGD